MAYLGRTVLFLTIVYLTLTSRYQLSNVLVGGLLAVGVVLLLRLRGQDREGMRGLTAVTALAQYVLVLAWELLVSGVQVARIVLDPKLPIQQGIIAIPSGCRTELGTALSAHAITLTPGEMVVEIDDNGVMYTHALDVSQAETAVSAAQKQRKDLLDKIFP
ncbi:MAG: Na+/H+ antiporter subunit E [Chloroflexi bacterium]|nr:Na+/H+ antiporter subunit E [Chloroflexota bacterium]